MAMEEYPEHEKLVQIMYESQTIGEFLDWLQNDQHILLCQYQEFKDSWGLVHSNTSPINKTIQQWLAEYFGVSQEELDKEQAAMVEALRAANAGKPNSLLWRRLGWTRMWCRRFWSATVTVVSTAAVTSVSR